MNDVEMKKWVCDQRNNVVKYLIKQGIDNPNVGEWPAFEVAPYFAIWAVESKMTHGRIGWWAFSGDCPTDYVSEDGKCHPRNGLKNLINEWNKIIPEMKNGRQPAETKIGNGHNITELGQLLEKRVSILTEWLQDDDLWEDR